MATTRLRVTARPSNGLDRWEKAVNQARRRVLSGSGRPTLTRKISVIIPAHNEEAYLGRTLSALQRQNYPFVEIIVVANGCTDGTARVAAGRCDRLIVLSEKNLGVSRNLGARMAEGEILMFLDADTTLEPMALRRIAEDFTPAFAAGTVRGRPDSRSPKYNLFYWIKNSIHRWRLHPGSSGVILCWREHFIGCAGFDEGLEVRENSELMKRLMCHGGYCYVNDVCATTSMRRYEQRGCARMLWLWCKLGFRSWVGDLHKSHYETVR